MRLPLLLLAVLLVWPIFCCKLTEAWSWVVVSSVNGSGIDTDRPPPCPSYCLNVVGGTVQSHNPVGIWWCQGVSFPNEQWVIRSSSDNKIQIQIVNADGSKTFCLDVDENVTSSSEITGSNSSLGLQALLLSDCSAASSQRWDFEPTTMRLRSFSSSGSNNYSYVQAYRPPGDSNYYLYLTNNAIAAISFVTINNTVMHYFYNPPSPSDNDTDLIINGKLQLLTQFAPLQIPFLDYTEIPYHLIVDGFDFVVCRWSVDGDLTLGDCNGNDSDISFNISSSSGQNAEYLNFTSNRCKLPDDWCRRNGNQSQLVFLNYLSSPPQLHRSSIFQTVPTYPGSPYLLIFDMLNPFNSTQRVQLSVAPTNLVGSNNQIFEINANHSATLSHQLKFVAEDHYVNVTFASQDSTNCGPSIGNVQLYMLPLEKNCASYALVSEGQRTRKILIAMVVLGWTLPALFLALFLAERKYRYVKRQRIEAEAKKGRMQDLEPTLTVFSYQQLKDYTDDFNVMIGEGGFGKVYYGKLPKSGEKIAVKRQIKDRLADDIQSFQMEVELLSRVHHRYLVRFIGYCDEQGERMLVFEYMPWSLYKRLHDDRASPAADNLNWPSRLRIAYQVAYALEYLHHGANPPILHRDIKSANVLLSETLGAKLADMGICKVGHQDEQASEWTSTMTMVKGSRGYMDPHYLQTSMISEKSDVYSLGVLLLELLTGRKAIDHYYGDDSSSPAVDFSSGNSMTTELLSSWAKRVYEKRFINSPQNSTSWERPLLDPRLHGTVCRYDVEAFMETAKSCLNEEPKLRPSMVEVAHRLRDLLLIDRLPDAPANSLDSIGDIDSSASLLYHHHIDTNYDYHHIDNNDAASDFVDSFINQGR